MNKLYDIFLKNYHSRDIEIQQKVKSFVLIAIAGSVLMFGMMLQNIVMHKRLLIILSVTGLNAIFILALFLVRAGRNRLAVHMVLVPSFLVIWGILFTNFGREDLLMNCDTVVYIFALISFVALTSDRISIAVYTAGNIAIVVGFSIHGGSRGFFTYPQMLDYISNNVGSLVIVGFSSYAILRNSRISNITIKNALHEGNLRSECIKKILEETKCVAGQLASSTEEMSSTTTSFSSNTQSQASSVEEIASTVEQVAVSGESIYSMAHAQSKLIENVREDMENLFNIVMKVGEKMQDAISIRDGLNEVVDRSKLEIQNLLSVISTATSKFKAVQDTVNVIEDISDKINLLSLNASIEAARAREYGRGFAVVANEIGNLAVTTSANLKSINNMFNLSNQEIGKVYGGLEDFVATLNGMIDYISEFSMRIDLVVELAEEDLKLNKTARISLGRVHTEANNILDATSEQRNALEEIAKSISVINVATQEIAIGARDISGTSRELAENAQQLMGISKYA